MPSIALIQSGSHCVTWTLGGKDFELAGRVMLPPADSHVVIAADRAKGHYGDSSRWSIRTRIENGSLLLFEHDSGGHVQWTLEACGQKAFTHRQFWKTEMGPSLPAVRLGGFSQYGQLFDFRDWVALVQGEDCLLICALRPGMWEKPCLVKASFSDGRLRLESVPAPGGSRRILMFTWGKAADLLRESAEKFPYFSPDGGHVAGAASKMAVHGFARPQRLANIRRLARATGPAQPLSGPAAPALSPADLQATLATIHQFAADLSREGWLHPMGNPVAIRPLVPALICFHLADVAGQWTPRQRQEAVENIATLAELIRRSEFYPHRWAMKPPEVPYSNDSLYRGMLNQNFHTDCYSLVGVAGCILADHPWARQWRSHAVRQLQAQLQSFVWPGAEGRYENGAAWEESHTYAIHVIRTLAPLLLALKSFPEGKELPSDPRWVGLCRFFVRVLSPPDRLHGGQRVIPAIGDHHIDSDWASCTFAWMATLLPQYADEFLWAWNATGRYTGNPANPMHQMLRPPTIAADMPAAWPLPSLPAIADYPGYGVVARHDAGQVDEALLVVRCGQAWGHYHHDQGSFWWWARGQLLCCDADLGSGELKFKHEGHNILGYPGRTPMQYIGRQPFIAHGQTLADGYSITCSIPVMQWQVPGQIEPVPANPPPHHQRIVLWHASTDSLEIHDTPSDSPDGKVHWNLHVPALHAAQVSASEVRFDLENNLILKVSLPHPQVVHLRQTGRTWWLQAEYPECRLVHSLKVIRNSSV